MEPFILKTISVKNLAQMALPDFCPRCFGLQARMGFKAPWAHFPGVFAAIDSYSKGATTAHLQMHKRTPDYLTKVGDVQEQLKAPHWSKFSSPEPTCGLVVRGVPDEMLRLADNTLAILDYKTSKHTEASDALLPLYQMQLAAYRWLAEKLGYGTVSKTGLVYFEPQTETVDMSRVYSGGFDMPFAAHVGMIDTDASVLQVPELMRRAKAIAESGRPEGLVDCKDCALVEMLHGLA